MLTSKPLEIKSNKDKNIYVGSNIDKDFFAILEAEGIDKTDGDHFLKSLSHKIGQTTDHTLAELESAIASHLISQNMPAHASFACGLILNDKIYLKTVGECQIYLRRGEEFAQLIDGGRSASGYIQSGDLMILIAPSLFISIGSESALSQLVDGFESNDKIVDGINNSLTQASESSFIGLLVSFEESNEVFKLDQAVSDIENSESLEDLPEDKVEKDQNYWGGKETKENIALDEPKTKLESFDPSIRSSDVDSRVRIKWKLSLGPFRQFFSEQVQKYGRQKAISLVAVTIIFIVFICSVAFSGLIRTDAKNRKKIEATRQIVTEKLNSAEEVAFLNLPRATALFTEAKEELDKLRRDVPDKRQYPEIDKIELLIAQKEGQIFKKEEKQTSEYYDLSVENKEVNGLKIALSEDTAAILDSDHGTIYLLSLAKKSLDKRASPKIKGSKLVAIDKDRVLFYKEGDGIFMIDETERVKQVLDRDGSWGTISDMGFFNRNLYLLDSTRDAIYKYGANEEGYGNRTSYINSGQISDLSSSISIAIDGNVYVGGSDKIIQYLAGDKQVFDPIFPDSGAVIAKIFSSADTEKVWASDRQKGVLYGISKTGSYDFQIRTPVLKTANEFVVFKDHAYILDGAKIYDLSLN